MSDEVDVTNDRIAFDDNISVKNICSKAKNIPKGQEGDCDLCGEHFLRVVEVVKDDNTILACGRCRDKHRIP